MAHYENAEPKPIQFKISTLESSEYLNPTIDPIRPTENKSDRFGILLEKQICE